MKFISIQLITFFLGILIILGCPRKDTEPPIDSIIAVNNLSGDDLLYKDFFGMYPDTSIVEAPQFSNELEFKSSLVKANSKQEYPGPWIYLLEQTQKPMTIFLFSRDTVEQVPWEIIRSEYKVLRRLELTKEQLDSMNWTITYP